MNLSKTEEQLMNFLWKLGNAPMKDLIAQYEDPKPATTTIATLLKRIADKGFINFKTEGRSRRYFPLVSKEDYVTGRFKGFVKSFFGNSASQFASFFTNRSDMTEAELEELKTLIDQQLKERKS